MKPWIGIIRLVNGQRQPGGHPCCAWFTPPLHQANGRQDEYFAMALELSGSATSRLYRDVRDAAAQSFWSTPGSPVAALRRAVIAANQILFQFNRSIPAESRCWGSLACAALRPDEVFLALSGQAEARLLSGQTSEQYLQQAYPFLGTQTWTEVFVAYHPLQPGTTLLLAAQNLTAIIAPDALDQVLRRECEEILDGLEQLAGGESLTAMVISWAEEIAVPPEPPRCRKAPRPAEPPAAPAPSLPEILPEPAPAPPEPFAREPITEETGEEVAVPETGIRSWQVTSPRPPSARPSPAGLHRIRAIEGLAAVGRKMGQWVSAAGKALSSGVMAAASVIRAVKAISRRGGRILLRRVLPGAEHRRRVTTRPVRLPPSENPRRMATVALFILILVALITLLAWFQYGRGLRRGQAISQAQEHILAAQQASDPHLARSHWESVLAILADYDDPEARALRTIAQDALDTMDSITRATPLLVADLSPASGHRLAAWEQSVAVLEDGGQVRHLLIGGESEVFSLPQSSLLIDVARYQPESGQTAPVLLILGTGARLWVYDSRWTEARLLTFSPPPGGRDPVAMGTYQGRLYLLDPMGNQIWRYWPQGEQFAGGAEPYFSSEAPSLAGARDLAIDGNIYVLFEDGQVARYLEGKAVPFAVTGVPQPPPHFVALTVDPGLTDGPVYLADGAAERIVVLRADGVSCAQLRAPGEEFRGLQALTISDTGNDLFISAGKTIYRVPIPSLPCR